MKRWTKEATEAFERLKFSRLGRGDRRLMQRVSNNAESQAGSEVTLSNLLAACRNMRRSDLETWANSQRG